MSKLWLRRIVNFIIPKQNYHIYALPHDNGKADKMDIVNYSGDNLLTLLNYWGDSDFQKKYKIYVEIYDTERLSDFKAHASAFSNKSVKFIPVKSDLTEDTYIKKIIRKTINHLLRYRCLIWMTDAQHTGFNEKVRNQKLICLNYSTPFKSPSKAHSLRSTDFFVDTSLLAANIHSSEYCIKLENCYPLGFPRNDNILNNRKKDIIYKWIKSKTDTSFSKIFLYVPTYRDYKGAFSEEKSVLGVGTQNELVEFLELNDILLITKYHPLQDVGEFDNSSRIISYEKTYEFTVYDMMPVVDALISDYSSILHDFMLLERPIIHNCFDEDKYNQTRGFAFDPIEIACPGEKATNWEELKDQMLKAQCGEINEEKYKLVKAMFHKYDRGFTERVFKELKTMYF